MIVSLKPTEIKNIHSLFRLPQLSLVGDAILAGNSPALAWTDDPGAPASALVWDKAHCIYLLGEAGNGSFGESLKKEVVDNLVSEVTRQNLGLLKIYPGNEAWDEKIPQIFNGLPLKRAERVFFTMGALKIPDWQKRIPQGFAIHPIDRALLEDSALMNRRPLLEEIQSVWNSVDRFLGDGFGVCVTRDGEVAGWCTAEYVSPGKCGVGVEILEAFQRRGLATLAASAVVAECVSRGVQAHWDAWQFNTPSLAIAERVGFEKVCEYTISYTWLTAPEVK